MSHFLDDDHRGFLIEHLVDGHHRPHLHQCLDDLRCLDRHLVRQIGHGNRLGYVHIVYYRFGRLVETMRGFACFPSSSGTLARLAVAPARSTRRSGRTANLQSLALTALFLPLALPVTFLIGRTGFGRGFHGLVLSDRPLTLGHRLGGNRLLRRLGGTRGFCFGLSLLFQANQFRRALLLLDQLGLLTSAQLGLAALLFGAQALLFLANDRRTRRRLPGNGFHLSCGLFRRFARRRPFFPGRRNFRRFGLGLRLVFRLFSGRFDHRSHFGRFSYLGHLGLGRRNDNRCHRLLRSLLRLRWRDGRHLRFNDHRGGHRRLGRRRHFIYDRFGKLLFRLLLHRLRLGHRWIALDEHAFLADFHLNRTRFALCILRLDFSRFLAHQGNLVPRLDRSMRTAQKIKQSGLVLLSQQIIRSTLVYTRLLQLLKQRRRRHTHAIGKLGNARLRHKNLPLLLPSLTFFDLTRTSARAPW